MFSATMDQTRFLRAMRFPSRSQKTLLSGFHSAIQRDIEHPSFSTAGGRRDTTRWISPSFPAHFLSRECFFESSGRLPRRGVGPPGSTAGVVMCPLRAYLETMLNGSPHW
jgi:hypothetical protein